MPPSVVRLQPASGNRLFTTMAVSPPFDAILHISARSPTALSNVAVDIADHVAPASRLTISVPRLPAAKSSSPFPVSDDSSIVVSIGYRSGLAVPVAPASFETATAVPSVLDP